MVILDIRYMYRNWIYYIILNIIYNHGNNINRKYIWLYWILDMVILIVKYKNWLYDLNIWILTECQEDIVGYYIYGYMIHNIYNITLTINNHQ